MLSTRATPRATITFWAWAISLLVHLALIAGFTFLKFSKAQPPKENNSTPVTKIRRIEQMLNSTPVIPKPRIKTASTEILSKTNAPDIETHKIFNSAIPVTTSQKNPPPLQDKTRSSLTTARIIPTNTEFFGQPTDLRKICYLVDCSGSMQGLFGQVRSELARSLGDLKPDQYFSLLFFGDDKLFQFKTDRLTRASKKNIQDAQKFIASIKPAGRTNALTALEAALNVRDSRSNPPQLIYFLTDAFELTGPQHQPRLNQLLQNSAANTRINTIGFWPRQRDRDILKQIAEKTAGQCTFISSE